MIKYLLAVSVSLIWFFLSLYFAIPWIYDVSSVFGWLASIIIITGVALLPGLTMAFVYGTLLFNNIKIPTYLKEYPPITILIAAYNEENTILRTLKSINEAYYPSNIQIIVCDDGSRDNTKQIASEFEVREGIEIGISSTITNYGKSAALSLGLYRAKYDYIITIDADTEIEKRALKHIVSTLVTNEKDNVVAVAGNVQVKNPNINWITQLQNWDYIIGISAVKQAQSAYKGTLVAQGAFSIYKKHALDEIAGWPETVGEDIVLTWKLLQRGYNILYDVTAISFTNVPITYKQFYNQRKRWSRGLVEAFKSSWKLLFTPRKSTPFVWYNLSFPYLDISYILFLVPGILAAIFFQYYLLAGLFTLLLIPMAILLTMMVLVRQYMLFKNMNIDLHYNYFWLFIFAFSFQLFLVPATLYGYYSELLSLKKSWGTK
jgi:biofilm PGA synthesis N-glycosyltransferase PgaC